jgi:gliding motility-associated-like protein
MPNAFSPTAQSDDYTRLFGPRNVSLDLEYFRIFNRWGQLVFETRDVGYRWDGKFKGVAQPMDTYVWIIRGKCPNGQLMEKKGNVTLLR